MAEFKLTRKAAAELEGLLDFSRERFGVTGALQLLGELERRIQALARATSRGRSFASPPGTDPCGAGRFLPVGSYYERVCGILRVLRIYHGARGPL